MVNEYKLLNGLKTVLDADATLSTLLKVKTGSTKVVLGPSRPTVASNPTIQLFVSGHPEDEEAKWGTLEVTAAIFSSDKEDGTADVQEIADIADRVVTLFDETPPTLTGHRSYNQGLTGFQTVVPAGLGPDGKPQHVQEVRFVYRGIKTT